MKHTTKKNNLKIRCQEKQMTLHNFMFDVQNNMNKYDYLFRDAVCNEEAKAIAVQKDKYIYKWHILSFMVNNIFDYSNVVK